LIAAKLTRPPRALSLLAAAAMEEGKQLEVASRVAWTGQQSMDVEKAVGVDNGSASSDRKPGISMLRLFLACMVSGGIQYGWALQLSLLSPYSQACIARRRPSFCSQVLACCHVVSCLLVFV
jgi:hypothetical protein